MPAERTLKRVAPVFCLLGDGRLDHEGVNAVIAVLEAEGLPTVPEARLARACQISFRAHPAEHQAAAVGAGGALRRLLATLALDLRPWAVPAGVRGATAPGCRLLFTADQYEVVIQETIDRTRHSRDMVGQVLRDGDPVARASVLLVGASRRAEAECDDDGSFRFRNVGGGSYELDIWAGDDLIVCAPVVLDGARR